MPGLCCMHLVFSLKTQRQVFLFAVPPLCMVIWVTIWWLNNSRLYYTKLSIGTPSNDYHVQVDTGSDILWVNCAGCDKCPEKSNLGVHPLIHITWFFFPFFLKKLYYFLSLMHCHLLSWTTDRLETLWYKGLFICKDYYLWPRSLHYHVQCSLCWLQGWSGLWISGYLWGW